MAAYGETVVLWVVEDGKLVRGVDLRPHIRLRVGDAPAMSLATAELRDEKWKDALATHTDVAFEIDWDAIALATPALVGEPLKPGEAVPIEADEEVLAPFDSYLEITEDLAYGHEDLDGGEKAPPGFVDPDPLR
jgi:hypothetical protein